MEINIITNKELDDPTKGERFKKYRYMNERKELTKKLLQLLGINSSNKMFNNIDINEETQTAIMKLIPNVQKYYAVTKWYYFHKSKKSNDKPYISISKNILKDMDIKIISSTKRKKINEKYVTYTLYAITTNIDQYIN